MIYKGCQKKIILLRDPSGKLFEEAYFILKDDVPVHAAESDMVSEANRIVREAMSGRKEVKNVVTSEEKGTVSRRNILWMTVGFIVGAGATLLLLALI